MCKMKLPVTAFPRWGMYMAIPIHTKLWTPSLATCYQKNPQIFIFILSQTSEVLFITQNCRYLLWLVAKQFLSKGWIVSENIHFLQTPFKSATTVFSWLSHAEQVETILNAHLQKICSKRWSRSFMLPPNNALQGQVLSEPATPNSWKDLRYSYHSVLSQICKIPEFMGLLRYTHIILTLLLILG